MTDQDQPTPVSAADDQPELSVALGAPTRLSTAVVLGGTVGVATLLSVSFGFVVPMVAAVLTAVVFAGSLWLVARDHWRVLTAGTAGVLTLFVGGGVVVAVTYATLQLVAVLFPVPSVDQLPAAVLRLVSAALVVVGSVLAMLGGVTAVGNVLRVDTVERHFSIAVQTLVLPFVVAGVMVTTALLSKLEVNSAGEELGDVVAETISGFFTAVFVPSVDRTHLLGLLVLVLATNLVLWRAVHALPLSELPTTDSTVESLERGARMVRHGLLWASLPVAMLIPPALLELVLSPRQIESLVTEPVYIAVVLVTSTSLLRVLLIALAVAGLSVIFTVWALRRLAQASTSDLLLGLAPFVGGVAVLAFVVTVREPALALTIEFVADRLPSTFAELFRAQADATIDFYGETALVASAAAILVAITACLSFSLWMVMLAGYLPQTVAGPALGSAGLFVAATFAGAAGAAPPLMLVGIVTALLVWDVGEYGVTLGREIGRRAATHRAELVHASGTLAVGVVGAVGANVLYSAATGVAVSDLATLPFALAVVIAGLFALVLALR